MKTHLPHLVLIAACVAGMSALALEPPRQAKVAPELNGKWQGLALVPRSTLAGSRASRTSDVLAASDQKYDAAYSVCKAVVPVTHKDFSLSNDVGPASAVMYYFMSRGEEFDTKTWKVTVIEAPKHGVMVPYPDEPFSFNYRPENKHRGPDQMTFVVEAQGKRFKVIETVWVADVAPEYGGCPPDYKLPPADGGSNRRGALDVLEQRSPGSRLTFDTRSHSIALPCSASA